MTDDLPQQRPEGAVIQAALVTDGRSIRQVAPLAGMSDARWRQIVKGHMTTAGHTSAVIAPAATLARMAHVVGVSPDALTEAGRADAAGLLKRMGDDAQSGTSAVPLPVTGATGRVPDEIDMIYASKTMTAQEKLDAIRKVLHLRAEIEAQTPQSHEAGAERTDAPHAR